MAETFLRRPDVQRVTGLPRSSIYALMKQGQFPRPIRITSKTVGWLQSEIEAWQAERIAARDAESD